LLRSTIKAKGFSVENPQLTIEIIEHLAIILRHKHHNLHPKLSFEDFLNSEVAVDQNHFTILKSNKPRRNESGTPPIQLQSALLRHLLLFHNQTFHIYEIIESFVNSIWEHLDILDFKKTKTGVIRCYTNTRFAANILREYGLLRFTHKEAYKTWKLSLSGFLVAVKLIDSQSWCLNNTNERGHFLRKDILQTLTIIENYDEFVNELTSYCEPQTEIFKTYEDILQSAYDLHQFWHTQEIYKLTVKERKAKCLELIKKLEAHKDIEKFYDEFAIATLNSELMKQILKNGNDADR
jgi:hypothetical protein